jgi:hypothetical protein
MVINMYLGNFAIFDFTLIQCIKRVSKFLGRDMSGTTFLGSKLVSFNQSLVPDEMLKVIKLPVVSIHGHACFILI